MKYIFLICLNFLWATTEHSHSITDTKLGGQNAIHPNYASTLAKQDEARFTLGVSSQKQKELAVSAPYIQIIISEEKPNKTQDTTTKSFSIATGTKLSDFISTPFDFTLGMRYKGVERTDSNTTTSKEDLWFADIGFHLQSFSVLAMLSKSGDFSSLVEINSDQSQTINFALGTDKDFDRKSAALGYRKTLLHWLTLRGQIQLAYYKQLDKSIERRQDRLVELGTEMRFRPYIEGRDSKVLKRLIDPLNGSGIAHILYDVALNVTIRFDLNQSESISSVQLSKWF